METVLLSPAYITGKNL